jgi:predicted CxxxxCH...CXXCH cytochrome family protein
MFRIYCHSFYLGNSGGYSGSYSLPEKKIPIMLYVPEWDTALHIRCIDCHACFFLITKPWSLLW